MIITDEVLKTSFKYGMSVVEEDKEDATPMRGLPEPPRDPSEHYFAFWINEYSETYFPREAVQDGNDFLVNRNGVLYRLTPLPKEKAVKFR